MRRRIIWGASISLIAAAVCLTCVFWVKNGLAQKSLQPQTLTTQTASTRQPVLSLLPKLNNLGQLFKPVSPKLPLQTSVGGALQTHVSPSGAKIQWIWRSVKKAELFGSGGICPNDINQGSLSDAYLLSALAALATQDPGAINNMVNGNADGTYTVTFNQISQNEIDGFDPGAGRVALPVDGSLPFDDGGINTLLGAQLVDQDADGQAEIGVALIEKAFSMFVEKLHLSQSGKVGYAGVEGGFCDVALTVLSGKNYVWTTTDKLAGKALFVTLSKTNAGMPAVAVSASETRSACGGIVAGHAYTVLGTFVDPGTGGRYVVLRNPWGQGEPASDGANDGIFSLAFGTFEKCFSEIDHPASAKDYATKTRQMKASASPTNFLPEHCR